VPATAPAVYTPVVLPFVNGDDGAANAPSVPENVATVPVGIVPPADVSVSAELNVRSAVRVEDPPGTRLAGDALDLNTRNGLAVTVPATLFGVLAHPSPATPGPELHPHQLFVAVMVADMLNTPLPVAPVLDTMRLRLSVDVLVPTGTDSAPPRAPPPETVLTLKMLLVTDPVELFHFAARREVAYDHKPSMLQDVEAGRATEIDFLNGAIVTFGERHGVDAPLNRTLTALVKGLEQR